MIKYNEEDQGGPPNIETIFKKALLIKTKENAEQYLAAYIHDIMRTNSSIKYKEAEELAKDNLGYYAGYYGFKERQHMENMFGAFHPILPKTTEKQLTTQEVFDLGKAYATNKKES